MALSANSTIVMVGVVAGGLLGGPWGAAIGAALTTPIGIIAETILSPIQQTATIERFIFETMRNTIAAGAAGALTAWLTRIAAPKITSMFREVNRGFGGHVADGIIMGMGSATEASLRRCVELLFRGLRTDCFGRIFDAIQSGVFPSEWYAVDAMIAGLVAVSPFLPLIYITTLMNYCRPARSSPSSCPRCSRSTSGSHSTRTRSRSTSRSSLFTLRSRTLLSSKMPLFITTSYPKYPRSTIRLRRTR